MELETLRKHMDSIDNEILQLVAKRMELARRIAVFKQKIKLPLEDKKREEELLEARIKKMKELGIDDAEFVKQLFGLLMKKPKEATDIYI